MQNNHLQVSIVIPTYKDIVALKLILDALQYQTYANFEILIAEDDNAKETLDFLQNYNSKFKIKHYSHEDKGNRKATILNKVLSNIHTDYIIFIDGDTIPYSNFIESHIVLSEHKTILCGRRVNLGDKVSNDLRIGKSKAFEIEKSFFRKYKYLHNDNIRHYEQGIRLNPNSLFYKFLNKKNKNIHILGSNFSCFREDILEINGFDEDIIGGSKDDVDLEWRFIMSGCKLKSCRYCANLFHLNHSRTSRINEEQIAKEQMQVNQKEQKMRCNNGIRKYQ